ncbi:hypothetical protein [Streptomyces djakartensis]|uniref:hypothetical protein n=1 Tax=Streptomyces djakartensis TaxID=68193 RepID=UPI0034DFEF91
MTPDRRAGAAGRDHGAGVRGRQPVGIGRCSCAAGPTLGAGLAHAASAVRREFPGCSGSSMGMAMVAMLLTV